MYEKYDVKKYSLCSGVGLERKSPEMTFSLLGTHREMKTLNSSCKYISDLGQSHSKPCELDNGNFQRKAECLSTKYFISIYHFSLDCVS